MNFETQSLPVILKDELLSRVHKNRKYSLRAFARDLKVSHAFLSQVLSGKRRLSAQQANLVSGILGLTSDQKTAVLGSLAAAQLNTARVNASKVKSQSPAFLLEIDTFHLVSEWYHGAILELTQLSDEKPSYIWISRYFGITQNEARTAIRRLTRFGLIEISEKKWKKAHRFIHVPTARPELAIQRYHSTMIDKAKNALSVPGLPAFQSRDITGSTFAINPKRIAKAKVKIAKFRKSLLQYLSEGQCTEIYQLNVQLFSLSTFDANERAKLDEKK